MVEAALENPGLRRKIRPSKSAVSQGGPSGSEVWATVIPRVSESTVSLVAGLSGYSVGETDLDAILGDWDDTTLSLQANTPGGGCGLVQLDAGAVAALTEAQLIGRVLSTAVTHRAATPVDAALCDHVVSAWLAGAVQAGEAKGGSPWSVGEPVAGQRAAKVLLDNGDFRETRISITFGDGARTGVMRLLEPMLRPRAPTGSKPRATSGREAILSVPAALEAVLYRTRVPLSWLQAMKVGEILEIPRSAIEHVRLETADGQRVGRAHLGRSGAFRAVRVLGDDASATQGTPTPVAFEGSASEAETDALLPTLPDMSAVAELPTDSSISDQPAPGGDVPGLSSLDQLPDLGDLPIVD